MLIKQDQRWMSMTSIAIADVSVEKLIDEISQSLYVLESTIKLKLC
jgi:hypothetical protein